MKKLLCSFVFLFAISFSVHAHVSPTIEWQKCLGGSDWEAGFAIVQTIDGGFAIAGTANSNDGDVIGYHGGYYSPGDCWVVKLDSTGTILWQKCLGGSSDEIAWSLLE